MLFYSLFMLLLVALMARNCSAHEVLRASLKAAIIAYLIMGMLYANGMVKKIAFRSARQPIENDSGNYNKNPPI